MSQNPYIYPPQNIFLEKLIFGGFVYKRHICHDQNIFWRKKYSTGGIYRDFEYDTTKNSSVRNGVWTMVSVTCVIWFYPFLVFAV